MPDTTPTLAAAVVPPARESFRIYLLMRQSNMAERDACNRDGALLDLERSLSLARTRAGEWNVDPKRLGVIGFSAGGNLAAKVSAPSEPRAYPAIDTVDQRSCQPDFTVLVYPAYLDDRHGPLAPDLNLKADIPPTLLVHSEDDKTFAPSSKLYHAALEQFNLRCGRWAVATALRCRVWPEHGNGVPWLQQNLKCSG